MLSLAVLPEHSQRLLSSQHRPRPTLCLLVLQRRNPARSQRLRYVYTELAVEIFILKRCYLQGVRGIKTLDFAGTKEVVYERSDWPLAKLQDYFKNDTLALIGYGSQGHGQGLNARDNGLNVIVGVRKDGESWRQAKEDGWVGFFPQDRAPQFVDAFY